MPNLDDNGNEIAVPPPITACPCPICEASRARVQAIWQEQSYVPSSMEASRIFDQVLYVQSDPPENANAESPTPEEDPEEYVAEPHEDEPEVEPETCSTCEHEIDECRCTHCDRCDTTYDPEGDEGCECEICECCEEPHRPGRNCPSCGECEGCGQLYHPDSGRSCNCEYCSNCDEYYSGDSCANCRDEDSGGTRIREYNERAEDILEFFPPYEPKHRKALYLGVELETECKRSSCDSDVLADLQECGALDTWVIGKHDGSLNNGVEVVTAPSFLKEHQERWPKVLEAMRKHSESWKKKSTGMHVHVNRQAFTRYEIAKFVLFVNSEANRPQIVGLAGRTSPDYAALEKKCGMDVLDSGSRYASVNLSNRKTIEVRIFKGTLNEEHVLANIEFCHALAEWVKVNSLEDCDKWDKFVSFYSQKCYAKRYAHLIAYMTKIQPKIETKMKELALQSITKGSHFWENMDTDNAEPLLEAVNQ